MKKGIQNSEVRIQNVRNSKFAMRKNFIRILPGDKNWSRCFRMDLTRGRIVYRYRIQKPEYWFFILDSGFPVRE